MVKSISQIIDGLKQNKTFWFTMLTTYVLGFITHGYCFLNQFYSHDSMRILILLAFRI